MLVLRQKKENDEVHMYIYMYMQNSDRKNNKYRKEIDHKPCGATDSCAGKVYIFSQTCERQTDA
jgi:hypothetical protein